MKTLVIGGTGTVGSQVVNYLLKANQSVRVLTSSADNAARLPTGVESVIANLDLPATLPSAFEGVDKVFLLNAQSHTEVAQGYYAVAAAKRAGVDKIVYQSIHDVRKGAHIPHFRPKIAIEKAIVDSGLKYTFICPNNFFQNDFWFKEAIVNYGIYPQPFGDIGLSRVDVCDIAEAAVKTLLSHDYDGLSIPLAGPEVLNGPDTARLLSEQLGYEVKYGGNDLESWAAQAKLFLPAWKVEDWKQMYQFFQEQGLAASPKDLEIISEVLGRVPGSYSTFIKEHLTFFKPEPVTI